MNNLLVYTYKSGPRCISVQLQRGMSQLAVAAESSLSAAAPMLPVPNQLLPPI